MDAKKTYAAPAFEVIVLDESVLMLSNGGTAPGNSAPWPGTEPVK